MITRQTKAQLLVFLLISAVGLSYTGIRYAGLGKYFLDQGYVVSAEFVDSGGIFKGAEVTYRGVPSGKVEDLDLVEGGVKVDLRLRPGTEVPADVRAVVGNRSAVGEQYVDLQPARDGEPYLDAGDVIPMSKTEIPISPTQLVTNLDDFVRSIDTEALGTVLDELGAAFDDGTGEALQELVDSGNLLTQAALDALPETKALIRDGNVALNTQRDVAPQFRSFNADLALLTETLRSSDPDFRRLYANGTASANQLTALIRENRTDLPILLGNLVTVAQIQKVRVPAIRQALVTFPNVVAGGYTVAPGDGTTHFGLVTDSAPPPCRTGYVPTAEQRPGTDIEKKRPDFEAYCAEPRGSESNVRGSRQAPYAPGGRPFPENGVMGAEKAAPPPSTQTAQGSRAPSFDAATGPALLGDYDPVTGRVVTEDGQRMSIGTTSGAQRVFGDDSWQWLLLGPLSR
ncbi:MAG: mammalian cell entry protein [Frankiales bacterium]|nr:mammalian cell entry protein [Frankiales bacterium]